MNEYKPYILEYLLDIEEGLTAWEVEFIEDMAKRVGWGQGLTEFQKKKLIEIYDKHL